MASDNELFYTKCCPQRKNVNYEICSSNLFNKNENLQKLLKINLKN